MDCFGASLHAITITAVLATHVTHLTLGSLSRYEADMRFAGLTFADDGGLVGQSANRATNKKMKPMGNLYEIYALRYATMSPRTPHLNYLLPDPTRPRRKTSITSSG